MNLQRATQATFCAAFFFLPIAKPFVFVALLVALLLLVVSGEFLYGLRFLPRLPWFKPALVLSALPVLSLLVHDNKQQALHSLDLAYYWLIAVISFVGARRFPTLPWMRAFLCGLVIVFAYVEARSVGVIQFTAQPASLANHILYSQFLAIGVVVASVLYRDEVRLSMKALYVAAMALFFFGLISGEGRSGMLAFIVLLPLIFRNLFKQQSRGKVLLACVLALGIALLSPTVQTRIREAVSDVELFEHHKTETSLGYRFEMWDSALTVLRAHPLLGNGTSAFRDTWMSTPRTGQAAGFVEPHNAYLFFASSYGVIGVVALLWLYVALLWTGWRQRKRMEGSITFAFAVICLFGSLTNTMFMGAISHASIMMFIGLQGGLLRKDEPAK